MKSTDAILVQNWFPAGHLYYYVAMPLDMRLIAEGKLTDIHKFAWLNLAQQPLKIGEDAYYISPSNNFIDPNNLYADLFKEIKLRKVLEQHRGNKIVRYWNIYQLKSAKVTIGNKHPLAYQE